LAPVGCDALVSAAVTLILEMLRRYPISGVDEDLLRWHTSAQSLGRALWRLGVWPFLLSAGPPTLLRRVRAIFRHLETAGELDVKKLVEANQRHEFEPANLLPLSMFGGYWLSGGGPATVDIFFRYPVPFLERFVAYNLTSFETATDPIDDLSRWPVPNELARFVINYEVNSASPSVPTHHSQQRLAAVSVLGLTTAIHGSPSVFADSPETALEAALLGAAHIVRDTERTHH
jgi:hypothetical protein